jgi:hypothetical protein
MNYNEIIKEFEGNLQSLPNDKRLKAGIAVSKKLFFDYQRFFETYHWGNPDILLDAIHICEESSNGRTDIPMVKSIAGVLDSIIPDMDDFGELLGSYALNASLVVHETLQFILDGQLSRIIDSGSLYLDTIAFRIHEETGTLGHDSSHPSMAEAREFLVEVLQ